jgi:phage terminase small subunit
LRKPEIVEAIAAAKHKRMQRLQIQQDRVVEELAAIGFAKITDVVSWKSTNLTDIEKADVRPAAEWDEDGDEGVADALPIGLYFTDVKFRDSIELPPNIAAAIAGVKKDAQGKLSISMHDKKGALVSLGRHLGMFDQKLKIQPGEGGDGGITVEIVRAGK